MKKSFILTGCAILVGSLILTESFIMIRESDTSKNDFFSGTADDGGTAVNTDFGCNLETGDKGLPETDPLVAAGDACVWIEAGNYSGSGVLYEKQGGAYVVVTAAHLFDERVQPEEVVVTFFDDVQTTCSFVKTFPEADIAFLLLNRKVTEEDEASISSYPVIEKKREVYDQIHSRQYMFLRDFKGDNELGFRLALVEESSIYVEDFGQYMLLLSGEADPGMSGCGVLDENGVFIGILVGANSDGELVAIPYGLVQSLYERTWD